MENQALHLFPGIEVAKLERTSDRRSFVYGQRRVDVAKPAIMLPHGKLPVLESCCVSRGITVGMDDRGARRLDGARVLVDQRHSASLSWSRAAPAHEVQHQMRNSDVGSGSL